MKTSFRRLAYNIFFRFSPILFVILLELALRFFGVGESYLLFNDSEDGRSYRLNQQYYRRFVSAEQFPDVTILPQEIPVDKPENSYRIFLIGDQTLCSTFPDINEKQLINDFKDNHGNTYDIVQMAVPLTNSFAIKRLVKCVNRYEPDACIVVTGANEFYGLPRKSAWMQDIDNYWGLTAYVTMKNHRFIQFLERFIYIKKEPQTQFPPDPIDDWTIGYDTDEYKEDLSYFDRNIKRITAKPACPIFMVSTPSNIKYKPYRSMFADKELSDSELAKECAILVSNADPFTIDRWINDLEAWEPETAIYYYCKAMIAEGDGNNADALEFYNKALELDAFRVRFNRDMYQSMAKYTGREDVEYIDLYREFNSSANGGLSITQYFKDGITLNEKGKTAFIFRIKSALMNYFNP
jgi:tetratricopeptide (TPR) repeat protein